MERVGKVWSNLKRGCQSLLHPDGDVRDQATTTLEASPPPRPPSSSSATPTVSGRSNHAVTTTRSISGDLSVFSSIRRHPGQNCAVVDMAQVLEITLEQEVDGRLGQLGMRRDSYSRHAPWSGKKRHSCSTRAQGSLEGREGRGSGRGGGGRCRHRGDELDADGGTTGGTVRTLRQQLQDTMGLCLPLRCSTSRTPPKRKIHLTELMMETCPFPPNSDLARKWHLIKQHTTPTVANAGDSSSSTTTSSSTTPAPLPPSASTLSSSSSSAALGQQDWPRGGGGAGAALSAEDEEERLRERRRLSIEEGVDPPPNAQIHTLEAAAPLAALHKLGPKLAPGLGEGLGEAGGGAGARGGGGGGGGGTGAGTGAAGPPDCDSEEEDGTTLCLQTRRSRHRHTHHPPPSSAAAAAASSSSGGEAAGPWRVHTQIDYIHCLVPDLQRIAALPCYWGVMDRYQAEALLDGRPEGSFLLRDSAQEDYLFSVSFRRYGRSLHARIEQWNHNFSFDAHDPCVFHAATVTALLEHYKDPSACMFFEPLLTLPLARSFPFGLQTLARGAICGRVSYDSIGALPLPPPLQDYLREYHYKQRVRVRWLERELKVK
ncbi:suppressor of cytokine signaling 5a [Engraulis encrasicolus]|uniref:suppressor of cytokine signaling 5a n=1 Tax=Engraulis encrasicolus TaxID=184585 RepID=UPI002FD59FFA